MSTIQELTVPLTAGDKLSREEFLRRWEAMPDLKKAELIGGIVYMPSPLSRQHGVMDYAVAGWLVVYASATPGCETAGNATWLMLEDSPQPDGDLRILPAYGGKSKMKGKYASGAPELTAEICLSSTAYDLHQKLDLYKAAGVIEYLAVLLHEQEVRWHRLVSGDYQLLTPSPDGILRSIEFPGLWLHVQALLQGDMKQVLATLAEGLNSPEHQAFVDRLARQKRT